jgi:pyruvate dehydrogenase E2 component (dihydrolipoamide acetyltransferase)
VSDVIMPRLSDSMEEGTIVRWLKPDGAEVRRGDELVEIETDKATMTYEADEDGTLSIIAVEGATLPIGEVIARIGPGGAPDNGSDPAAEVAAARPMVAPAVHAPVDGLERVKASPVARRIAREAGVDITTLRGSGPGGRIVKADVEAAVRPPVEAAVDAPPEAAVRGAPDVAAAPPLPPAAAAAAGDRGTAKGETRIEEPNRAQQVVARRMAEAKATVPEFTLQAEVDMERAMDARAQLKSIAGEEGIVPTLNDLVVKACSSALRAFPRANGAYRDGRFELYSRVNVGVAVAAGDSLVVPVVFDADRRGLGDIAATTRGLAARVREGSITPPELSGATFTVSNLGMYGITSFTAIINPPQAAILAVGALEPKPVVREGAIVVRHVMPVTLACDHRILYGAQAAEFLAHIRTRLEHPAALAL